MLVGAAAVHPAAGTCPRRSSIPNAAVRKGRLMFLCLAVLTGPLVLIFDGNDVDVAIVAVASTISFLLVMARLTGLNWRLSALGVELEVQAATDWIVRQVQSIHPLASPAARLTARLQRHADGLQRKVGLLYLLGGAPGASMRDVAARVVGYATPVFRLSDAVIVSSYPGQAAMVNVPLTLISLSAWNL